MKKILAVLILSVLLVHCKDNPKSEKEVSEQQVAEKKQNLVGGWRVMESTPMIKDLANYVLKEHHIESPVMEITNVSSQVVSGRNFKFDMTLEDGKRYMSKVYVNIQGEKKITDFKLIP